MKYLIDEELCDFYMKSSVFKFPEELITKAKDVNLYKYEGGNNINRSKVEFSHHVLCLLIKGKKDIYHSDANERITNSHFFLLQSGNTLMIDRPQNEEFRSILFFYTNEYLIDLCLRRKVALENSQLDKTNLCIFEKDDYIVNYQQTLLSLQNEYLENEEFSKLKLDEIFSYLLLSELERTSRFISKCLQQEKQVSFKKIVENHKYTEISTSEIAFLCNMSISTFNRRFQDVYKVSPKQYFLKCQMEKAQKLLLTGRSVSEVCDALRYQNISAFSRQFRKYFGVSPTEYLLQSKLQPDRFG